MIEPEFVPHADRYLPPDPPGRAARAFAEAMSRRRSVRQFSDRPVARETIEEIVRAAAWAPSGANKQPWRFVCVSDPGQKHRIRMAVEQAEREFYAERASEAWLRDLAPLGTDADKRYLEVAPWLIVVFRMTKTDAGGQVYYGDESVGIAVGMLLTAAHMAGLATLTHTPAPMKILAEVLGRPAHERAYMLIPVGHAADDCAVPKHALTRRPFEDVAVFVEPSSRST